MCDDPRPITRLVISQSPITHCVTIPRLITRRVTLVTVPTVCDDPGFITRRVTLVTHPLCTEGMGCGRKKGVRAKMTSDEVSNHHTSWDGAIDHHTVWDETRNVTRGELGEQ